VIACPAAKMDNRILKSLEQDRVQDDDDTKG
jgi:hypothetical protein